jgi:hypothetical protein
MNDKTLLGGLALGAMALAAPQVSAAQDVKFIAGTYHLAQSVFGPPSDTLDITVTGGMASFTLSGSPNITWQLPDVVTPDVGGPLEIQFNASSVTSPSWDTVSYPFLFFFATGDSGGVAIGTDTNIYVNVYESTEGTGQVFAFVPEPAAWALMLVGFGGLGAALRSRRKATLAA